MIKKIFAGVLIFSTLLSSTVISFAKNGEEQENSLFIEECPGIQWVKYFGEPHYIDGAEEVRLTSDGGYILVGATQAYTSDGEFDAWLIKTDKNGDEEWNQTYGDIGFLNWSYGYSVQQTQDGGFVFAGARGIYPGDLHAWVMKTSADGTEQWNKMFNNSFRGYSIVQTTDGGYIIAGDSSMMDVWLCRIDGNGNVLWERTFYVTDGSVGYSVQQTFEGGFVVAGRLYYQQNENESGFLIKTDADGNEEWNKTYSGLAPFTGFFSVQVISDGYIIAGFIDQPEPHGQAWLVRTNELGNAIWDKSYSLGLDASLMSHEVACTTDGGFVLTGNAAAPVPFAWILKTDGEGNEEWHLSLIEEYPQELLSVQETLDGSFIVAGHESGAMDAMLIKIGHVPQVTITKPVNSLYLFNKERRGLSFPFIIGPITIEADANDSKYNIKCVEFIIDDILKFVDYSNPYSWKWTKPVLFFHTIQVTAINEVDNSSIATLNVLKFF